ncbi:YceI family protein [Thermoflexibacter ruber]|uniref:Polyisoprenoid-binding protein YceI n=1 Tax=Thermoflexibacter ruber TaxID=1003 RepID=A0A1I2DQ84_9BACT|nr:YceI family protein [Thermoflexibacter ruber]SFE82463.1 Polyisoprenoid-binding protein YceI [Thermoflexibacter ruber]
MNLHIHHVFIIFFLSFLYIFEGQLLAQKQWQVKSSSVTFKIKNAGFTVDGKFGAIEATIFLDKDKIENTQIEASIEAKTIDTGIESRDNHLRKQEYFDVARFPKIIMKSKRMTKLGLGTYEGVFDLYLKGIIKEIKFPFTYTEVGDAVKLNAEFTLNRLDFGIGGSSWIMSDRVTIMIMLTID